MEEICGEISLKFQRKIQDYFELANQINEPASDYEVLIKRTNRTITHLDTFFNAIEKQMISMHAFARAEIEPEEPIIICALAIAIASA